MKRSRFSQEQIIGMIKEQEAGLPAAEVCLKHGISSANFYKYWALPIGENDLDTYPKSLKLRAAPPEAK